MDHATRVLVRDLAYDDGQDEWENDWDEEDWYPDLDEESKQAIRAMAYEAFQSLPRIKASDLPLEDRTCAICLDPYNDHRHPPAKMINCTHAFGLPCIREWLVDNRKHTCPVCREKIYEPPEPVDAVAYVITQAGDTQDDDEELLFRMSP